MGAKILNSQLIVSTVMYTRAIENVKRGAM